MPIQSGERGRLDDRAVIEGDPPCRRGPGGQGMSERGLQSEVLRQHRLPRVVPAGCLAERMGLLSADPLMVGEGAGERERSGIYATCCSFTICLQLTCETSSVSDPLSLDALRLHARPADRLYLRQLDVLKVAAQLADLPLQLR